MKRIILNFVLVTSFLGLLQSCSVVIKSSELGVKQKWGKLDETILKPGVHFYGPISTKIFVYDCKIQDIVEKSMFSTHDGLEVSAHMNLLYHINKDSVKFIYKNLDTDFHEKYVGNLFNSVIREEIVKYNAKDVMSKIEVLQDSITIILRPLLQQYGFVIDKTIISDIDLPEEISKAIKDKVKSEQTLKQRQVEIEIERQNLLYETEKSKNLTTTKLIIAKQEAEFEAEKVRIQSESRLQVANKDNEIVIIKQKTEAERIIIEQKAESERLLIESKAKSESQKMINSTLSEKQLELKRIEATEKLASSTNTKLIITDGKSKLMFKNE